MHLDSRRVSLAGITDHPEACWMRQVARNAHDAAAAVRTAMRAQSLKKTRDLQPRESINSVFDKRIAGAAVVIVAVFLLQLLDVV